MGASKLGALQIIILSVTMILLLPAMALQSLLELEPRCADVAMNV